ncbi:MAG: cache domain-containing protein, partial [Clostridiaceae bacterium]
MKIKHKKTKESKNIRKKDLAKKAEKKTGIHFIKFFKGLNFKSSIFGRLFLSFIAIILLSLLFIGITTSENVKKNAKESYVTSAYSMLNQNINYVDLIMKSIDNYSIQLSFDNNFKNTLAMKKNTTYEKFQVINSIQDIFNNIRTSNTLISSIYFLNPDGIIAGSPSITVNDKQDFEDMDFYKEALELDGSNYWMASHNDEFSSSFYYSNFYISDVHLIKNISTDKGLGVLQININTSTLNDALKKNNLGDGSYTFITDDEGNIVCSPDFSLLGTNASEKEEVSKTLLDEQG